MVFLLFFFNDTATTEIYTLSLHDALPISRTSAWPPPCSAAWAMTWRFFVIPVLIETPGQDRKSTRLNSSHLGISYAVFCLKKKNREMYIVDDVKAVRDDNKDLRVGIIQLR